jgi:hypothetical protein
MPASDSDWSHGADTIATIVNSSADHKTRERMSTILKPSFYLKEWDWGLPGGYGGF